MNNTCDFSQRILTNAQLPLFQSFAQGLQGPLTTDVQETWTPLYGFLTPLQPGLTSSRQL